MKELVYRHLTTKGQTVHALVHKINRKSRHMNTTKQAVQSYLESLLKDERIKRSTKPDETGAWKWRKA